MWPARPALIFLILSRPEVVATGLVTAADRPFLPADNVRAPYSQNEEWGRGARLQKEPVGEQPGFVRQIRQAHAPV